MENIFKIGEKIIDLDKIENPHLKEVLERRTCNKFHFWSEKAYHEKHGYPQHSEYSEYGDHVDRHNDRHRDGGGGSTHNDFGGYNEMQHDEYGCHTDKGHSEHNDYHQRRR